MRTFSRARTLRARVRRVAFLQRQPHPRHAAVPEIGFERAAERPALEYAGGRYTVAGTDRGVGLFEFAAFAEGARGRLVAQADFVTAGDVHANGCHACEVTVDPDDRTVRIERHVIVADVGRAINPLIVHGQIHGGAAQGMGQALPDNPLAAHLANSQGRIDVAPPRRRRTALVALHPGAPTGPLAERLGARLRHKYGIEALTRVHGGPEGWLGRGDVELLAVDDLAEATARDVVAEADRVIGVAADPAFEDIPGVVLDDRLLVGSRSMGSKRRWEVPSRHSVLSSTRTRPSARRRTAVVGERGAEEIAAGPFEAGAIGGGDPDVGVEIEAIEPGLAGAAGRGPARRRRRGRPGPVKPPRAGRPASRYPSISRSQMSIRAYSVWSGPRCSRWTGAPKDDQDGQGYREVPEVRRSLE